eukprot:687472-Amorphochlora_amoeboformis.AAC.1
MTYSIWKVQNCIPSMVWFSTALSKACYPTVFKSSYLPYPKLSPCPNIQPNFKESKKWREGGLLSG